MEGCGAVALRRVDVDFLLDQTIDSLGIALLDGVNQAEVTIGPCRDRGQEKAREGDQRLLHRSDQPSAISYQLSVVSNLHGLTAES